MSTEERERLRLALEGLFEWAGQWVAEIEYLDQMDSTDE